MLQRVCAAILAVGLLAQPPLLPGNGRRGRHDAEGLLGRAHRVSGPATTMKFLLTSQGVTNASIRAALVDLLGKPIAESKALCIPTGVAPFPRGPNNVYDFIAGSHAHQMCGLGWKSLGVLELTALPSIR